MGLEGWYCLGMGEMVHGVLEALAPVRRLLTYIRRTTEMRQIQRYLTLWNLLSEHVGGGARPRCHHSHVNNVANVACKLKRRTRGQFH